FDYSAEKEAYLERIPKIKARLERLFQCELAKLVDFNYIAKNFTSELIDEISEIDPDGICDEAVKIETRGK
ncbi:MAG: hypothetical protein U9R08_06365, partial [Nanoarchaeota archaeon]|nr:hypothetical protein [Nanoarchaeota archaeon]